MALNSNAVLGIGTAFISNGRVGDAFRGPDGAWYEITNIASDTALSISPNYQGPTNTAGVYAIAPMQGYVKDSADALRVLVNQFGTQLAALSDTDGLPEGPSNKYFTDARVRGAALQGLVTTDGAPVVAADTVLAGIGKLQAQVSAALPKAGGTLSGSLNHAPIVSLASSSTPAIGAAAANTITITGTTGITGFDSIASGVERTLIFAGVVALTHNAVSLILPSGLNITTAPGDVLKFTSLGSGKWRCTGKLQSVAGTSVDWSVQPLGMPIPLFTNLTGVEAPPTDKDYRYIKLSAGDSYNSGALTSETTTGAAPLVQSTAVINLAGSPLNGQTIRLINTEERVLRAGVTAGTALADAIQNHTHYRNSGPSVEVVLLASGGVYSEPPGGGSRGILTPTNTGSITVEGTTRIATETRAKSISAVYYMRIK